MGSLLNILACAMLVFSWATTATAHALERPNAGIGAVETPGKQSAEDHVPGDADEVPADGDKDYPHHHGGCHGDHVAIPFKGATAALNRNLRLAPTVAYGALRPLAAADPALKPPQA